VAEYPDVTKVCLIAVGHTVSQYTLKCNFIYKQKKKTALPLPIFTKQIKA